MGVEAGAILRGGDRWSRYRGVHGPRRLRGRRFPNCVSPECETVLTLDLARINVDLAVAVRAQHYALRQLENDLLPRSRHTVSRDAKFLLARVPMVELE